MRLTTVAVPVLLVALLITSVAHAAETRSVAVLAPLADALAAPLIKTATAKGLVVGLLSNGETVVHGYGKKSSQADAAPDGQTLFEIGSITKVFTGLLLADAIERGELKLNAPLDEFLPDSIKHLRHDERTITLWDLVTHTSRLPRMPRNFAPADATNPYVDYTAEDLYEFLSNYKLRRTPGAKYAYSNLGMGLLGHILSQQAGLDYATLVRQQITKPLNLPDTVIKLNDEQLTPLAQGHDADAQPVANWDFDAIAGAGALRSTADDMLRFLQANLNEFDHPLKKAFELSHSQRRERGSNGGQIALAWHIQPGSGFIWHNGGTGGYRSFTAFHHDLRVGVVVLSNTATPTLDALGLELTKLLAGKETQPLEQRTAIKMDPKVYAEYIGKYQLAPGSIFDITRSDERLMAQLTGQPAVGIYPEDKDEFFYRAVDAQISFVRDDDGHVASLILHQGGRDLPAKRIEAEK